MNPLPGPTFLLARPPSYPVAVPAELAAVPGLAVVPDAGRRPVVYVLTEKGQAAAPGLPPRMHALRVGQTYDVLGTYRRYRKDETHGRIPIFEHMVYLAFERGMTRQRLRAIEAAWIRWLQPRWNLQEKSRRSGALLTELDRSILAECGVPRTAVDRAGWF